MRMIDADAFKKHLASFVAGGEKAIEETTCGNEWIDGVHTAYREIDDMPTIERPHGEWIKEGGIFYQLKCSNCNFELRSPDDKSKFCPNCGADMREGDRNG